MEWTPDAIKAEIDYRQAALRQDAAHNRLARQNSAPKRSWWKRSGHHRPGRDLPEPRNDHHNAA